MSSKTKLKVLNLPEENDTANLEVSDGGKFYADVKDPSYYDLLTSSDIEKYGYVSKHHSLGSRFNV